MSPSVIRDLQSLSVPFEERPGYVKGEFSPIHLLSHRHDVDNINEEVTDRQLTSSPAVVFDQYVEEIENGLAPGENSLRWGPGVTMRVGVQVGGLPCTHSYG